jgi:hypothetical protein
MSFTATLSGFVASLIFLAAAWIIAGSLPALHGKEELIAGMSALRLTPCLALPYQFLSWLTLHSRYGSTVHHLDAPPVLPPLHLNRNRRRGGVGRNQTAQIWREYGGAHVGTVPARRGQKKLYR